MELIDLCNSMTSVPTDVDQVYVIGIDYKIKNGKVTKLRIVFSTLRLLKLGKKNLLIATDGTHKLIWQGLPCVLTGMY